MSSPGFTIQRKRDCQPSTRLEESYWMLLETDRNGLNCVLRIARRIFVEKLPSASSIRLNWPVNCARKPRRGRTDRVVDLTNQSAVLRTRCKFGPVKEFAIVGPPEANCRIEVLPKSLEYGAAGPAIVRICHTSAPGPLITLRYTVGRFR